MEQDLLLDDEHQAKAALNNNADIAEANKIRMEINENIKAINHACYAVYVCIGFLIVGSIIEVVGTPELLTISVVIVLPVLILFGLGVYLLHTRKPVAGLGLCLFVYLGVQVMSVIGEPSSLGQGIIGKIAIVYFMIRGISQGGVLKKQVEALKGLYLSREEEQQIYRYKKLSKLHYLKPNQ